MAKRKTRSRGGGAKVCSIIVDGETEKWYLDTLKQTVGLRHLNIRPDLPKKKKLTDLYGYVAQQAVDYDKVIWVIDMDTTIAEGKMNGTLKQEMQTFQSERKKLEELGVTIIVNSPSLEEWLLLHYEKTNRYFPTQEPLIKHLKAKHLPEYEKTERFFKRKNNNIYQMLLPLLPTALANSKAMPSFNPEEPEAAACEMWKIFDYLKIDS